MSHCRRGGCLSVDVGGKGMRAGTEMGLPGGRNDVSGGGG